jgi:hypothetical protein
MLQFCPRTVIPLARNKLHDGMEGEGERESESKGDVYERVIMLLIGVPRKKYPIELVTLDVI